MLDTFVDIALEAGRAILGVYATSEVSSHTKEDGSPVTAADTAAEAIIVRRLRETYPGTPIVAEEETNAGGVVEAAARFFLVDPLDGTKEFLSRNGEFTVNIALIENGRPICGVVYAPAHRLIYAGGEGCGARAAEVGERPNLNWRAIACRPPPGAGLGIVASRSHMSPETQHFMSRFVIAELVAAGSSLKFCRVAAGEADLYPRLGRTMEWDTAAGDAVLRAAGGRVCTMDGALLTYGKRGQTEDVDYANPWFVAAGRFDPFAIAAQ
jgi:3'(2'),5'-bisphosphate nucleotidase